LAVAVNPSGVYVVGDTSGALTGQSSSGGQDAFVASLSGSTGFQFSLFYPRLASSDGSSTGADTSEYTGIAVANLGSAEATLRFTAYDKTGAAMSGTGITNPATKTLKAGAQLPIVDVQVFGSGLTAARQVGWMKLESTVASIAGFFLMFNSSLSILDGAGVSTAKLTSFVLPEIEDQGFTQIHVANPDSSAATLTFDLVRSDGTTRTSATRTVNPSGAVAEVFTDLFPGITAEASDYCASPRAKGSFRSSTWGRRRSMSRD
jgi:hypothetical protein